MCGTLKYGRGPTSVAKIGDPVPVRNILTGAEGKAIWSGFAQHEKLGWWEERSDGIPIYLKVDIFVEGEVTFKIPTGELVGLGLRQDVYVNGRLIGPAKSVKLVTRPAVGPFEQAIHPRFPLTFTLDKSTANPHIFTLNDAIIGGQAEMFNA